VATEKLLERENCFIRTNLSLRDVGHFLKYIEHEHGILIDPRRVELISHEEAKEFAFHRAGGLKFKRPVFGTDDSLRMDRVFNAQGEEVEALSLCPVCYIIDEVQVFWPAGRTDKWLLKYISDYLTQSGKLGDDVFFISSDIDEVDKSLLRKVDDWYECRNLGKEAWFGIRLPRYFQVRKYLRKPNFFSKPMDTQTYPLNIETIGALYRTEAGVGILGTVADTKQRPKGIDWRLGAVAGFLLLLVVWAAINFGIKGLGSGVGSMVSKLSGTAPKVPVASVVSPAPAPVAAPPPVAAPSQSMPPLPPAASPPMPAAPAVRQFQPEPYWIHRVDKQLVGQRPQPDVHLTAVFRFPDGRVLVGISTGEIYEYPKDREVEFVDGRVAKISGKWYEFSRKPVSNFVAPLPQLVVPPVQNVPAPPQ
jgi:hypothetical protein